jgi:hypothetical protein
MYEKMYRAMNAMWLGCGLCVNDNAAAMGIGCYVVDY